MSGPAARPVVIIGAGGHGRVVADACAAAGLGVAGFLDAAVEAGRPVNGVPILGDDRRLDEPTFLAAHRFVVAIGQQTARRRLSLQLLAAGAGLATVVHPSCIVSPHASLGAGTVVFAGVVVNANARIGRFCIVNTGATVDHDCVLADGCHVCPGAHLAGDVRCGEDALIGTGAAVIPGIAIGARAVVGAGAAVVRPVPDDATVAGVPARAVAPRAARP